MTRDRQLDEELRCAFARRFTAADKATSAISRDCGRCRGPTTVGASTFAEMRNGVRHCHACVWLADIGFDFAAHDFTEPRRELTEAQFASLRRHAVELANGYRTRATEPEPVDFHLDEPLI